jgi:hypothetical protein
MLAPEDVAAKSPSSRARRRAIAIRVHELLCLDAFVPRAGDAGLSVRVRMRRAA